MPREAESRFAGENIDSVGGNNPTSKSPKISVSPKPLPTSSVNLLKDKTKSGAKKILKRILIGLVLIIVILGSTVAIRAANLSQKIFVGISWP